MRILFPSPMNLKLLESNNVDNLFTALIAILTMNWFSGFSVSGKNLHVFPTHAPMM